MIAVILCIILLSIVIWIHYHTEPFENTTTQGIVFDPTLVKQYHDFAIFIYNPFMSAWKKAIITSMSSEISQAPLTDPSQLSTSTTPPTPSLSAMNEYINNLSQQQATEFPPVTNPLPESIDETNIMTIAPKVPTNPAPFLNAVSWMNKKLEESHSQLQSALRVEGFDQQTCQDLSQCFLDNPELLKQCANAAQRQQQQSLEQQAHSLLSNIQQFTTNRELINRLAINASLMAKSKQIQDQAQSGDLLNQLQLPDEPSTTYKLPDGANVLGNLQKNDPAKYKALQQQAPAMFSLQTLFNQINQNLR